MNLYRVPTAPGCHSVVTICGGDEPPRLSVILRIHGQLSWHALP
jgi:hypothetical protein